MSDFLAESVTYHFFQCWNAFIVAGGCQDFLSRCRNLHQGSEQDWADHRHFSPGESCFSGPVTGQEGMRNIVVGLEWGMKLC